MVISNRKETITYYCDVCENQIKKSGVIFLFVPICVFDGHRNEYSSDQIHLHKDCFHGIKDFLENLNFNFKMTKSYDLKAFHKGKKIFTKDIEYSFDSLLDFKNKCKIFKDL